MDTAQSTLDDFRASVLDANVTVGLLSASVAAFRGVVEDLSASMGPDRPLSLVGSTGETMGGFTSTDMVRAVALRGDLDQWAGQSWILRVYTVWEHEVRPRLRAVMGDAPNVDIMGDLRLMRNDIAHNQGIASTAHSGRVKVLSDWVSVGSPIAPWVPDIEAFLRLFPWDASDPRWP